jgi:hypothetical protein
MAFFKGGIELNLKVYNQERVQYTKTVNDRFIFFPTYSITKYIFEKMRYKLNIFTASPGIGTTFSIIMLI